MNIRELLSKSWVRNGLIIAVVLVLLSPLFGYAYEPLDVVAETFNASEISIYTAPMPDYLVPFLGDNPISGIIAGLVGTIIVFFVSLAIGYLLKRRND